MQHLRMLLILSFAVTPLLAQKPLPGPTNEKAQKSYKQAMGYLSQRQTPVAFEEFKKADKLDCGRCQAWQLCLTWAKLIPYGQRGGR
jgi:hypothetical protein